MPLILVVTIKKPSEMKVKRKVFFYKYQHSAGMPLSVEAIFNAKPCIPSGMHLLLELSVALSTERCIPDGMQFQLPNIYFL